MKPIAPTEILMLEEDHAVADLVLLALEREGYQAAWVRKSTEWWAALEKLQPRLVLLDLFLSGQSGLNVLQEMKDKGWLERTQVVVLSSLGFREVVRQAMQLGAVDFVVKPFDVETFIQRIRKCLPPRVQKETK